MIKCAIYFHLIIIAWVHVISKFIFLKLYVVFLILQLFLAQIDSHMKGNKSVFQYIKTLLLTKILVAVSAIMLFVHPNKNVKILL